MSDRSVAATQAAESAAAARDIGKWETALNSSGVDARREWSEVRGVEIELNTGMSKVLSAIEAVRADKYMPSAERLDRLSHLQDLGESLIESADQKIRQKWPAVDNLLESAAMADLQEAEPGERQFIHAEIESYIRANPRKPMLQSLTELAQRNPGRYGAAIAGTYGEMKMAEGGADRREHAALQRNIRLGTPGASPKAVAARAAIEAAAKAKAHTYRTPAKARGDLEAALAAPKRSSDLLLKHPRQW